MQFIAPVNQKVMVQTAATSKSKVDLRFLAHKKIAIVVSLFNSDVCEGLLSGAKAALAEHSVADDRIEVFKVPGAFEIPLTAKMVAKSGRFAGVIALGCVIRGETPHFEFVSLAATMGCLQAGLEAERPVLFGVITVNTLEQALARARPDEFNKGREATLALFDTLTTLEKI